MYNVYKHTEIIKEKFLSYSCLYFFSFSIIFVQLILGLAIFNIQYWDNICIKAEWNRNFPNFSRKTCRYLVHGVAVTQQGRIVHRSGKLALLMYWRKETEKLFHYNFSISNIGKDWEGEEEGRGDRRKGKRSKER